MRIVILDGYTANPGDLDWTGFSELGELTVYDRTSKEDIISRAKGYEIVIANKTPMGKEELDQLPDVKYIGLLSTGYNIVDLDTANERGIVVTNVPAYSTKSVAQLVFAYILDFAIAASHHSDLVHNGRWSDCKDFCFWDKSIIELEGKTIGILGFGSIGRCVAKIAKAFDMNVIVYTRTVPDDKCGCEFVGVEELFKRSDFLSVHCPLTDETKGIVNKEYLSLMKKSSYIINTSRGPVINEEDLAFALNNDMISGAAMDVLSTEPPKKDNPLLTAKNCMITPHLAWASRDARERLIKIACENLKGYLNGSIVNKVNK